MDLSGEIAEDQSIDKNHQEQCEGDRAPRDQGQGPTGTDVDQGGVVVAALVVFGPEPEDGGLLAQAGADRQDGGEREAEGEQAVLESAHRPRQGDEHQIGQSSGGDLDGERCERTRQTVTQERAKARSRCPVCCCHGVLLARRITFLRTNPSPSS